MFKEQALTNLLSEFLGFPKQIGHGQEDIHYNCPKCEASNHRNRFKLYISLSKKIFHCWTCGYKGRLQKVVYEYGSQLQVERYKALKDTTSSNHKKIIVEAESLSLSAFRSLKFDWKDSVNHTAAVNYLKKRNIGQDIIDRWDICYAESGKYKNRIIIPSKSTEGKVEYFVARDFYDTSPLKYKNPKLEKTKFIFGEKFIDWKKPVFITEGVFDAIIIYNSVPILGTNLRAYEKLVKKLIENRSTVILGFDSDKIGKKKEIEVAKYLLNIGCTVYTLPKDEKNDTDLSDIYKKSGKAGIISLIKSAEQFDELSAAILTL